MTQDNERSVPSAAFRTGKDVFIIYSFEDVAFHWEAATQIVRRRFRRTGEESKTVTSNRLFCDAQMGGRLASEEEYEAW